MSKDSLQRYSDKRDLSRRREPAAARAMSKRSFAGIARQEGADHE